MKVIIIAGPSGVGKSRLGAELSSLIENSLFISHDTIKCQIANSIELEKEKVAKQITEEATRQI